MAESGFRSVAALDIGGTKIEAGVVSADGTILHRRRAPTQVFAPSQSSAGGDSAANDPLTQQVIRMLEDVISQSGVSPSAVGVGCAGPMSGFGPSGATAVSPLNIEPWSGHRLGSEVSAALDLPTYVDNDAKALAMAEGRWGAAKDTSNFLAMVVSTGVGGGLVLNGAPLDGREGNAGHIGHLIVEPNGARCVCGARGCLEAEASGMAIERRTGSEPRLAPREERLRCGRMVGRAVASVANLLDLRLAVVAGSVALGFSEPFFTAAQEELDRLALLDFSRGARIRPAGCGADGPLLGAAMVANYRGGL